MILLDRDYLAFPERSDYDLVAIDNIQAGYRVARHLVDAGSRSLRFLTHADYANAIRGRIQGVAQAAIDAGLKWKREYVIETDPSNIAFFERLMRGRAAPDAFACRNDPTAALLMQTLSKIGIRVPEDVRVAGFDDSSVARLLTPPLTTIHQPVEALASIAVSSLIQRMRIPSLAPRTILLDAPLVRRASTS